MTNIEKYEAIIRNVFELGESEDVSLVERGVTSNWDSLGHITLVVGIEDGFDIMIDPQDILKFKTYNDGLDILKKNGVEI